jgi:hypothetical protein
VGHFCPPESGSTDPIESGSNWDPDPQPCWQHKQTVIEFNAKNITSCYDQQRGNRKRAQLRKLSLIPVTKIEHLKGYGTEDTVMYLPKRLRDRILDTVVVKYLHLEMQNIELI